MALAIRSRGKPKQNHCAEQHPGGRVELTLDEKRPKVRVAGPAHRGRGFVMFIALLGYIGTMAAAFVTLVMVWHQVIGPPQLEAVRQQPRLIGAVTQAAAPPVPQPGSWGPAVIHKADDGADAAASAEDARLAAAQAAAAEKTKRLKQARYQKRKEQEQLARQSSDQQYSTALGYNQDPSQAPVFGMFGPRRF
jgi:hypothetical protein